MDALHLFCLAHLASVNFMIPDTLSLPRANKTTKPNW